MLCHSSIEQEPTADDNCRVAWPFTTAFIEGAVSESTRFPKEVARSPVACVAKSEHIGRQREHPNDPNLGDASSISERQGDSCRSGYAPRGREFRAMFPYNDRGERFDDLLGLQIGSCGRRYAAKQSRRLGHADSSVAVGGLTDATP